MERITFPVSRLKAWRRSATALLPGAALVLLAISQAAQLNLRPSAMSNRLTEYAWLAVYAAVALFGLRMVWKGVYWALVGGWWKELLVSVDDEQVIFEMGPMGRRIFDARRIHARYPFDEPDEGDDGLAEALRDPDGYRRCYLPRMTHPGTKDRLDMMIRHLTDVNEADLARQMRPFVEWRRKAEGLDDGGTNLTDE